MQFLKNFEKIIQVRIGTGIKYLKNKIGERQVVTK